MDRASADAVAARRAAIIIESSLDSGWPSANLYPDEDDRAAVLAALMALLDELHRRGGGRRPIGATDALPEHPTTAQIAAALTGEFPDGDPRVYERLAFLVDQIRSTGRTLRAASAHIAEDVDEILRGVDPADPRRTEPGEAGCVCPRDPDDEADPGDPVSTCPVHGWSSS